MGIEAGSGSYYRWQVAGKAVAVNLSLAVVARLGPAVRQTGGSAPPRLPEIGGLLLGTVRRTRGLTVVDVDDFELVDCEHISGPSYFLSGAEQRRLAGRVRVSRKRGAKVVGLFRSNTRREFALSVEDVDLMGGLFSQSSMVMLLVDTPFEGPLRGGFFFWEQRAIRTPESYLDFPFDAAVLPAESGPSRAAKQNLHRPRWVSLTGAAGSMVRWPARLTSILQFEMAHAAEHGGHVPAIRRPQVFSQIWLLFPGRFRTAWLIAAAALAIAVLGVAMHPEAPPAAALTTITPQTSHEADRALPEAEPVATAPAPAPVPLELPTRLEKPTFAASRKAAPPTPVSEARRVAFPSAVQAADAAPVPSLPDAPDVSLALPKSSAPMVYESSSLPPPVAAMPDPFVSVEVDQIPNDHRGVLGKLRLRNEIAFVPPRPVRQPLPEIPASLRRQIRGVVPIDVNLYLNRAGAVEYAELLSNGTGPNREIASLAVFAARRWQFAPAHQGGDPVPAKVMVKFRFGATPDRTAVIR